MGQIGWAAMDDEQESTFVAVGEVLARMLFSRGPARAVPAGTLMPFPGHRFIENTDRSRSVEARLAVESDHPA